MELHRFENYTAFQVSEMWVMDLWKMSYANMISKGICVKQFLKNGLASSGFKHQAASAMVCV